jgi:hypothetical protein
MNKFAIIKKNILTSGYKFDTETMQRPTEEHCSTVE